MISNDSDHQDRLHTFLTFMKQVEESNWKHVLQKGCKKYYTFSLNIKNITPKRVQGFYDRINQKFYLTSRFKTNTWLENQLRIFVWLIIMYSQLKNTSPNNFIEEDWNFFVKLFLGKTIQLFKFQFKCILNQKMTPWNKQQEQLLISLIKGKQSIPNWNNISKEIFQLSNQKYFKSSKQCRQHWNNYLNPKILKSSWTNKQDYLLFKHVVEKGQQWSVISKILDSRRTQHMVKNRFKSLVIQYSKQFMITKKMGQKLHFLQKMLSKIENKVQEQEQKNSSIIKQEQQNFQQIMKQQQIIKTKSDLKITTPNIIITPIYFYQQPLPIQTNFQSFLPSQIYYNPTFNMQYFKNNQNNSSFSLQTSQMQQT